VWWCSSFEGSWEGSWRELVSGYNEASPKQIAETFDLHKVMYTGWCNGQVAQVCGKHKAIGLNDKSLWEVHSG
jgi:hypothetical protein